MPRIERLRSLVPAATVTARPRWVADPEPETWGLWRSTGRKRGNEEEGFEKEQERTSSYGNRQTRRIADWTFGG